jgi:hypothetical protein
MKVHAGRRRDREDIKVLAEHLGLATTEQVLDLCLNVFPDEPVPDSARLLLEDLLGT